MQTILDHGDFVRSMPSTSDNGPPAGGVAAVGVPAPIETDPAIVADLIGGWQVALAAVKRDIRTKVGTALLVHPRDMQELKRFLFDPRSRR